MWEAHSGNLGSILSTCFHNSESCDHLPRTNLCERRRWLIVSTSRWNAIEMCLVWLFTTILLPLLLIGGAVWGDGAAFHSTLRSGQLASIAMTVALTTILLEWLFVASRQRWVIVYAIILTTALVVSAQLFLGSVDVAKHSQEAIWLSDRKVTTSVWLYVACALCGIFTTFRVTSEKRTPEVKEL